MDITNVLRMLVEDSFVIPFKDIMESKAVKDDEAIQESLGELPLYEVEVYQENEAVSLGDPINQSKWRNRFKETDSSVKLSTREDPCQYKGFNVANVSQECTLEATNPLNRFIYSDYLNVQKNQGRLANAEGILARTVAGFRDDKNNEVSKLRGWQGINANDYVVPHPIGKSGVAEYEYKDAKDWYTTLSNILLGSVHIKSESKIKAREIVEIKIESGLS